MHFGENQLSRSLIGLSPLTTGHPPGFQPWWVRASTPSYRRFTLPMARSLRFGSTACDSASKRKQRPVQTRFRYGYPTRVNLATHHNSQAHSSKGTPSPHPPRKEGVALTACRHSVSGTISRPLTGALFTFPSRYWSAIGHQEVFRLTRWSWRIHTRFHEPRATREHTQGRHPGFVYRTLTVYGRPSQTIRLPEHFVTSRRSGRTSQMVPQPRTRNACRLSHAYGLASSPFAHHYSGNHMLFSLPAGTEMFHFPASPPTALYIQTAATPHNGCRVTPFGNPRIKVWLPTPRGISQAPTSFIGS
jgi:hypothetical protein